MPGIVRHYIETDSERFVRKYVKPLLYVGVACLGAWYVSQSAHVPLPKFTASGLRANVMQRVRKDEKTPSEKYIIKEDVETALSALSANGRINRWWSNPVFMRSDGDALREVELDYAFEDRYLRIIGVAIDDRRGNNACREILRDCVQIKRTIADQLSDQLSETARGKAYY